MNQVLVGDSLDVLKMIENDSVDLLCTDPPYGYSFMGKAWDKALPDVRIFKECLRVLKPGAFAFVMSAPRSDVCARMMLLLEEAGFNIGFTPIYWTYASGFPKAMNIGKMVDKRNGVQGEEYIREDFAKRSNKTEQQKSQVISGQKGVYHKVISDLDGSYGGFQPKPAVEVIIVAMKPLSEKTFVDQALKNGKGITWLDDARIPYADEADKATATPGGKVTSNKAAGAAPDVNNAGRVEIERPELKGRFASNLLVSDGVLSTHSRYFDVDAWYIKNTSRGGKGRRYEDGFTGSKPNTNDLTDSSVGDLQEDSAHEGFDSLPTHLKTFPFLQVPKASKREKNEGLADRETATVGDGRPVAIDNAFQRGKTERLNVHPTVKPLTLMSYLITLGSRPGDVVLDPFLGSGTTAIASKQLGRQYIGIEREAEYVEIAKARIEAINPTLL